MSSNNFFNKLLSLPHDTTEGSRKKEVFDFATNCFDLVCEVSAAAMSPPIPQTTVGQNMSFAELHSKYKVCTSEREKLENAIQAALAIRAHCQKSETGMSDAERRVDATMDKHLGILEEKRGRVQRNLERLDSLMKGESLNDEDDMDSATTFSLRGFANAVSCTWLSSSNDPFHWRLTYTCSDYFVFKNKPPSMPTASTWSGFQGAGSQGSTTSRAPGTTFGSPAFPSVPSTPAHGGNHPFVGYQYESYKSPFGKNGN